MLSEEEKEAIEILEGFEPEDLVECVIYRKALDVISNLIEKQEKVIDEMAQKLEEKSKGMTKEKWKIVFYRKVENNE